MSNELFSANTQIVPSLNKKGRSENSHYSLLTMLLFLGASFALWEFVYEACNMLGSVVSGSPQQALVELKRMLPLILTAFTYMGLCRRVGKAYCAGSQAKRAAVWKVSGIGAMVMGAVIALYVAVGYVLGIYVRVVEGNPSPLYPLDVLLGGLLFVVYGVFARRSGKKILAEGSSLPYRKKQPSGFVQFLRTVCGIVPAVAGMCGFAACCYGFVVMDWDHGMTVFNTALWLNYFAAFALLFTRRYILTGLKEKYAAAGEKQMGLRHLALNAALLVLYMVSIQLYPDAPNQNAFGLLPIEYTASVHAFVLAYGLNNLVTPLVWWIRGTIAEKKMNRPAAK